MENKNIAFDDLFKETQKLNRNIIELNWGTLFHDAIAGSKWLKEVDFCPGRWAIGYPYLYVLYRILNEFHPKKILDLGMGQTSKMISQYASVYEEIEHIIVESDTNWINFAKKSFNIKNESKIINLNYKMENYKNFQVRVYENFEKIFENMKFNLISIDAPFGGDMKNFSRIDIIKILPECLDDSFIILLDDYERTGEKNTIKDILEILNKNKIEYKTGKYSGTKDMFIITSLDNKWFCSL